MLTHRGFTVVSSSFNPKIKLLNSKVAARSHRTEYGLLQQLEMLRLPCECRFVLFEPLTAYRKVCPFALLVVHGAHHHPIPLPTKTPPRIRKQLVNFLSTLAEELADLTPRRLLRHPALHSFLKSEVPDTSSPTLSDLHISLANRAHLKHYITEVKQQCFPVGTGWEGAQC